MELPYGSRPLPLDFGERIVHVVEPPSLPPPPALSVLLENALDLPTGGPPLRARHVTIVVSDPSRREPRDAFVRAVRRRLPNARVTIAIATGTHGPCRLDELGLSADALCDATIINHDGHRSADLVDLGTTSRGTPVRVHRCVVETDLVVATGCIRPHYFAGFGAGVKAIFPGLGEATAVRINHRLKTEPRARAGIVVGNPCRDDLEAAVALLPTPSFLLNGVCRPDGGIEVVVAGDVVAAFRQGAEVAARLFTVRAVASSLVIASDALPVSGSLYQAAKIAAAVAPLVKAGGVLVVAAECRDGIGPLDTVNEAIFRIGVLPRLASGVRLVLVSSLGEAETRKTLLDYAPNVQSIVEASHGPVAIVPRASQLICEAAS